MKNNDSTVFGNINKKTEEKLKAISEKFLSGYEKYKLNKKTVSQEGKKFKVKPRGSSSSAVFASINIKYASRSKTNKFMDVHYFDVLKPNKSTIYSMPVIASKSCGIEGSIEPSEMTKETINKGYGVAFVEIAKLDKKIKSTMVQKSLFSGKITQESMDKNLESFKKGTLAKFIQTNGVLQGKLGETNGLDSIETNLFSAVDYAISKGMVVTGVSIGTRDGFKIKTHFSDKKK